MGGIVDFEKVKKAEDADVAAIRKALDALHKAGVPKGNVAAYTYNLISPSACDKCDRVWLFQNCQTLPEWEEQSRKRGRRLELSQVRSKLLAAGWNRQNSFCEACRLEQAEPIGKEVAKQLTAGEMKRFLATFTLRVQRGLSDQRFRDSQSYKFFILFTKAFFEGIPAKNRKSFDLLTQIMHALELL